MALIACFECGKQISERAMACPNCGNPTVTQMESLRTYLFDESVRKIFDDVKMKYSKVLSLEEKKIILLDQLLTSHKNFHSAIKYGITVGALTYLVSLFF